MLHKDINFPLTTAAAVQHGFKHLRLGYLLSFICTHKSAEDTNGISDMLLVSCDRNLLSLKLLDLKKNYANSNFVVYIWINTIIFNWLKSSCMIQYY